MARRIHTFYDGIVFGFLLVTGGVGKTDFKEIRFRVEKVSVPAIVEKGCPGKQFANICRQHICERVMRVAVLEK